MHDQRSPEGYKPSPPGLVLGSGQSAHSEPGMGGIPPKPRNNLSAQGGAAGLLAPPGHARSDQP